MLLARRRFVAQSPMMLVRPRELDRATNSPAHISGLAAQMLRRQSPPLARAACIAAIILADAVALWLSFAAAVLIAWFASGTLRSVSTILAWPTLMRSPLTAFAVSAVAVAAYFAVQAHYHRRIPFWSELQHVVLASLAALLFNGFIGFLANLQGSRILLVATWLIVPVLVMTLRQGTKHLLSKSGLWQIRTIIVGEGDMARQTIDALRSEPGLGYDVVGVVSPAKLQFGKGGRCWRTLLLQHQASLIVLAFDGRNSPGRGTIESLVRERVPFAMVPQLDGLPVLGFDQTQFFSHDTVLFSFRNNLAQPMARVVKIVFDYCVALVSLVILAPLLLAMAILVKLDGGPAFFAHTRVGAGGRKFKCLKFRSMVTNSAEVLQHVLSTDPAAAAEWAETQKLQADPRITPIGRVLRKTSLDELPQLFNVLRLEMSIVGPRPIVGAEVPKYGEDIAYYYETRPGLTGLWQVSGRTGTSYEQRVQLDTWYVKNWTIWHDLAIMAKTVPAVLKRKGAY
jgi:Undecaprenyl-phosphate galactose phosphotransferase WbaP